ncbi:OmpA family protein [Aurantibacter sp.]|uniref:OmpA family protein n=1 Tax=Aurantibacter sp. TaxID=2807103 RepID=UPI00326632A2
MINHQDSTRKQAMKKIIYTILFLICAQTTFAQDDLKRANTYFDRAFYTDAIPLYEDIAKTNKSSVVVKNLADSYYNTYQLPNAAKWYSYLTSVYGENLDESYYFKYSQTLKAIGEYEEATEVLMDYYASKDDSDRVKILEAQLKHLENVDAIGNRFSLTNVALNTPNSEFGALRVDDNVVYAAAKKTKIPLNAKKYRWNNQNYLDMYTHPISELAQGDSISKDFSSTINTKMHEATFAITKDRSTLYFTRNNFLKGKRGTDGDKISRLKIYRATWKDDKWDDITELPFNGNDFSTEHPALDASETTLYFASDRPGGHGSLDLYSVSINEVGEFGEPQNLGADINTERKEQFPFIDGSNNLYFSSNGHAGFGLLDVFVSKFENGKYQKPDNIGKPLNTGYDDFSFSMDQQAKEGFFASNRPDGKGSDDIYRFLETKPLVIEDCKQYIAGVITDKTTKEIIPFAELNLLDSNGEVIETQTASENAEFKFTVTCETQYTVVGRKTNYKENSKNVATDKERSSIKDGSLELVTFAELDRQEAINIGKAKEEEKRLAALAEEEKIREAEIKKQEEIKAKAKAEEERKKRIEQAIANEPLIERDGDRIIIKAEPKIYFDYDLWYIRLKSKETLDKIVTILKNHKGIQLEIGTHTDIRGNNKYNQELSQKRSNSVYEYLVESGIDKNRLKAKGYGETQTIVKCATEEACIEEQHEINRRCEFVIVDWK